MTGIHPLRAFRQNHQPKLSQAALGEKLGVARLTVLRWENGQRKIDDDLLTKVAERTGIPAKELRPDLVDRLEQLVGAAQ